VILDSFLCPKCRWKIDPMVRWMGGALECEVLRCASSTTEERIRPQKSKGEEEERKGKTSEERGEEGGSDLSHVIYTYVMH